MAQGTSARLNVAVQQNDTSEQFLVNGLEGPATICAIRTQRMIEHDGVPRSTLLALVRASYHHAKNNPRAYGRNVVVDEETYESSRLISEPYHIFDCSRENDASAAVLVMSAERAKHFAKKPAYVLSAPMGAPEGWGANEENMTDYTSAGFKSVARRLWAESGYQPGDVDVAQIYENFTGLGVAAIIDHGFCTRENVGEFLRFENLIAPDGKLPINTSGGSLAEGFIHGMGLVNETVRQIRGESTNQVSDVHLSLMTGGPGDTVVSSMLLGTEETL
jgi:acetyl-CoA acetyltransferase